eukprot:6490861-Amphidinium_carterae.5
MGGGDSSSGGVHERRALRSRSDAGLGAGASVCSPTELPSIAIDTKTAVTKVYRCADGRDGYKWVRALVGKTQQILQIRFTVLDVLRPIIALSCLVQGGWDLSFGGAPVEATAWASTESRTLLHTTSDCSSADTACTWTCNLQL